MSVDGFNLSEHRAFSRWQSQKLLDYMDRKIFEILPTTMKNIHPHYLLFSESHIDEFEDQRNSGFWRFILQSAETRKRYEAIDREFGQSEHRLALLAVIRGLEYLDQPSKVTLVTASRYVRHGFRRGLKEWSANQWQWERFGEMIPVRNADLWKRIHHAMNYHDVQCRIWRFDGPARNESTGVRKPNMLKRGRRSIRMAENSSELRTIPDDGVDGMLGAFNEANQPFAIAGI